MSTLPSGRAVLDEMARRVIDQNLYMVLGTMDPDGQPRLSPVYFTAARYEDFYWVSLPESHHSGNVADTHGCSVVISDQQRFVVHRFKELIICSDFPSTVIVRKVSLWNIHVRSRQHAPNLFESNTVSIQGEWIQFHTHGRQRTSAYDNLPYTAHL